jgi:hypothetical protein
LTARWENLFGEQPTTVVTPTPPSAPAQSTVVETAVYRAWGREHADVDEGVEVRLKTGEGQFVKHPFIMGYTWLGDGKFTLITSLGAMTFEGHHLAELRRLMIARKIDFVQEFDSGRWPRPKADEPVVDRIELVAARAPGPSVRGR